MLKDIASYYEVGSEWWSYHENSKQYVLWSYELHIASVNLNVVKY